VIRLPGVAGRRVGLWLALAGAAGLMAVVLTLRAAAQPSDGGWALVAARPIPAGTLVDAELASTALRLVALPTGVPLSGLVGSADAAVGRRTVAHLSTGEPVTEAVLGGAPGTGPAPLAAGERAVAAPLTAAAGAASALAPGVRVDVVASTGEGLTGRTRVVVADAEVLAVAPPTPAGDGGEVLLRVSSAQALTVTAALNFAREVRLLVRPAGEAHGTPTPAEAGAP
jgi:Flp pilus assembly protein CpaB